MIRFLFLHRWRGDKEGKNFATRMFTLSPEGKDGFILDPHGKTSHFVWRDPRYVMAWAWHPSHGGNGRQVYLIDISGLVHGLFV